MLQRLARFMYRRRRWVLGAWIILLVATFALASSLSGAFKTEFKLPGTESQEAFDLLDKSSFRNRQVQAQVVFAAQQGVDDCRGPAGDGRPVRRDRAEDPRRRRREPVLGGRRASDLAQRQDRVRADQLRRPLG